VIAVMRADDLNLVELDDGLLAADVWFCARHETKTMGLTTSRRQCASAIRQLCRAKAEDHEESYGLRHRIVQSKLADLFSLPDTVAVMRRHSTGRFISACDRFASTSINI